VGTITGTSENDSLYGTADADTIDGGDGDDFLDGFLGDDLVSGGAGSDWVAGGLGNDTLDGGSGRSDYAYYKADVAGVQASLLTGIAIDGSGGTDLLTGLEGLIGSNHNDTLTGDAGANKFAPYAGDDRIDGGGGADILLTVGANAGLLVDLSTGQAIGGGLGNDTLSSIEAVNGTAFADTLSGSMTSGEWFYGNAGDDVIDGRGGSDRVSYYFAQTGVAVNLAMQFANDGLGGVDTLTNIEEVEGSTLDDLIVGDVNGNYLNGAAGNDSLFAGGGSDLVYGGDGNDTVDGGSGTDIVAFYGARADFQLTGSNGDYTVAALSGLAGTDLLTGIERIHFSDARLAVDLNGSAGIVAKILGAVFGQGSSGIGNATYAGVGIDYADDGWSYESLMQMALQARLGGNATNDAVVDLVFTNVMGSAPDAATRAYFVSWITEHGYTQASLAVMAAEYMGIPSQAQNGLVYV
jgi:Ca2+-binding RTX toxin-like protein